MEGTGGRRELDSWAWLNILWELRLIFLTWEHPDSRQRKGLWLFLDSSPQEYSGFLFTRMR